LEEIAVRAGKDMEPYFVDMQTGGKLYLQHFVELQG
jgi:hypothetical protein